MRRLRTPEKMAHRGDLFQIKGLSKSLVSTVCRRGLSSLRGKDANDLDKWVQYLVTRTRRVGDAWTVDALGRCIPSIWFSIKNTYSTADVSFEGRM